VAERRAGESPIGSKRPSAQGLIAVLVIISCLLFLVLNAWPTWEARSLALTADQQATSNLARSLAEHAHGTIQAAETALLDIRERMEVDDIHAADRSRLHTMMQEDIVHLPMVDGLLVFDDSGAWVVNSQTARPSSALNISDRDYFIFHRDHPGRGVHVGEPIVSRASGHWVLPVSLRLDNPDGTFRGVAGAMVSIDFFRDFYKGFNPGREGAVSLASASGLIVARHPDDPRVIGADFSKGPIFSRLGPQTVEQGFQYRSPIDGVDRYGTVHRVPNYPLLVIVSHGKAEALANWTSSVKRYLAVSCIAIASLIILGLSLARLVKRNERTERQYRLLADYSTDAIVCATASGFPLYVSPSFSALSGRDMAEWRDSGWQSIVHSEDRDALMQGMASPPRDGGHKTVTFRFIRPGGLWVWCEALIRMLPARRGKERCIVANIRDITARKEAEDQVAALNAELSAMALSDALTGVANRRCFDKKLDAEWARAVRNGNPLSLIMLDIDHFKLFNDLYGHKTGDECLAAVGSVLASSIRRPEDLAARYGGEEFAVILPDTTAAGARQIADLIRAALEGRMIEHSANKPWGVVTASLGVATLAPMPGDAVKSADLIELADQALYRAKRSGRNKVAEGGQLRVVGGRQALKSST